MPEKPTARKIAEQEQEHPSLKVDLRTDASHLPDRPLSPEEAYLRRKAEVTQQDHEEFLRHQRERARQREAGQTQGRADEAAGTKPAKVNRRNFLTVVAGTAAVGEAA